jgi:aspartyl-tRNA(Asn)/glutamyl-tRNA(Gln) amidotransferase subunit A
MTKYRYATIGQLASMLRNGEATASEMADAALALIASLAPRYNALAALMPERARREAAAADGVLRRDSSAPILCGVPYAAKDLFAAAGAPTTWGSPMFREQVFDEDAAAIGRLSSSGGVLVAKLSLSELAGGGEPSRAGASLHGQGRNPWDPSRYSGGSSSGSAIAVALGLVPYALGTETGGSIVGPAAFTGITGLRPTFGTVPRGGVMTLSWSLDKVGPLARTAADCAIVLDAIADPPRKAGTRYTQAVDEMQRDPNRSLRIAFSEAEIDEADPSIQGTLLDAVDQLRGVFPGFIEAEIERDPRLISALLEVVRVEGSYEFRSHLTRPQFQMTDAEQQAKLASGLDVRAVDYLEAVRDVKEQARRAFERVFEQADVILSPSRSAAAQPLDSPRSPRDAAKLSDLLRAGANLAGIPGVSFPCGLSSDGLPVGLQVIGPAGSDGLLLGIAAAFQEATDYHLLRPPDLHGVALAEAGLAPETGIMANDLHW